MGSLNYLSRELTIHTSLTKRSSDFIAHLEQPGQLYGPKPGQSIKPVVLVEDNGRVHTSKLTRKARAARAHSVGLQAGAHRRVAAQIRAGT